MHCVTVTFDTPQNDLFNNDNLYKTQDNKYQYTICSGGELFQSYMSLVCFVDYTDTGRIFIDKRFYKYKKTFKYLSIFLGMTSQEIEKDIKEDKIRLCEINSNPVRISEFF